MKNCLLVIAIVPFLSARSQSEADRAMEKATCNCVGKMFESIEGNKDSFNTCLIDTYLATVTKKNEFNIFAAITDRKRADAKL